MHRVGAYEPVAEMHRKGAKSLWTARKDGSADPRFAIKFIHTNTGLWDPQHAQAEATRFLERATVQKQVANSGSHWAAVHHHGKTPDGAALVTDHYERNLQRLIGRVDVDGPSLHHIVDSIAIGLEELATAAQRVHGNLRPSAVLIDGQGWIAKSKIVLASPAASESVAGKSSAATDFPALGAMIFHLVTRTAFTFDQLPVASSQAWDRLPKGDGWRKLCHDLIDSNSPTAPVDLVDLKRRLKPLAPPVVSTKKLSLVGALFAALVGLGAIGYQFLPPLTDHARWEDLCDQYEVWVEAFNTRVTKQDFLNEAKVDPDLAKIIEQFVKQREKLDPRSIVGGAVGNTSYSALADASWEQIKRNKDARDAISAADETIRSLRDQMNKWQEDARGRFNVVATTLDKFAPGCKVEELNELADLANAKSTKKVTIRDVERTFDERLTAIIRGELDAKAVQDRLAALASVTAQITSNPHAAGEPLLKDLLDHQKKSLGKPVKKLKQLGEELAKLQATAGEVQTAMAGQWQKDDYPKTDITAPGAYSAWVKAVTETVPESDLKSWWNDQIKPGWDQALQDVDNILGNSKEPGMVDSANDLKRKLLALPDQYARFVKNPPSRIAIEKIKKDQQQFKKPLEEALALKIKWNPPLDPGPLKDLWNTMTASSVGGADRLPLGNALVAMNKAAPDPGFTTTGPAWRSGLAAAYSNARIELFKSATHDIARQPAPRWEGIAKIAIDAVTQVQKSAIDLTSHCAALDSMYQSWDVTDDKAPVFIDHFQQARKLVTAAPELRPPVQSILQDAAAIANLNPDSLPQQLKQLDLATRAPQVLWFAWKQLGIQPTWPSSSADFETDRAAAAALINLLQGSSIAASESRRLNDQFASSAKLRLSRFIARLVEATPPAHAQLRDVHDHLSDYALNLGSLTSNAEKLDLLIGSLYANLDPNKPDTHAAEKLNQFVNAVQTVPDARTLLDNLRDVQKKLQEQLARDQKVPEHFMGWTLTSGKDEPHKRIYKSPNGQHTLEFIKVTDVENGTAGFLCTSEVPVQLFLDVLGDDEKAWESVRTGWFTQGLDRRDGPRTWEMTEDEKRLNVRGEYLNPFINDLAAGDPPPYYEENARRPRPSPLDPIQHIPARSAAAFARLATLGCRLPTLEEWNRARSQAKQNEVPNLRDRTWLDEYTYLGKQHQVGADAIPFTQKQEDARASYFPSDELHAAPDLDNSIWFRPVPTAPDGAFHDLIGNVAEWVQDQQGNVAVIGGSAISDPNAAATPMNRFKFEDMIYADVGFRLALTDYFPTLAANIQKELAKSYVKVSPPQPVAPSSPAGPAQGSQ